MKTICSILAFGLALGAAACTSDAVGTAADVTAASGATLTATDVASLPPSGHLVMDQSDGATYRFSARAGAIDYERVKVRGADGDTSPLLDGLRALDTEDAPMTDEPELEVSWIRGAMAVTRTGGMTPRRSCTCCIKGNSGKIWCTNIPCGSVCGPEGG